MLAANRPVEPAVNRKVFGLMAAAAGVSVANLYYCQPLLPSMASTWGVSARATSAVATSCQLGYALGLLLIVPLGDNSARRRLIVTMLVLAGLAAGGVAAAPNLGWLIAGSFVVGLTTITPQLLIPFAAELAPPGEQGRIVGQVMSGLLVGILLARTLSGALAAWFGWRAVYLVAAGLTFLLALVLSGTLPAGEPRNPGLRYFELLRSLVGLIRSESILRSSGLFGAMSFAAFSAFWTVLPFLLSGPPYRYSTGTIGLFGLIGVTGVAVAPLAGRLSDAGRGRVAIGAGLVTMLAACLPLLWGAHHLWPLIVGIVLLDFGGTANHISNQSRVYRIRPEARNRINTVYMVIYFAGGALGSFAGAWGWSVARWPGFCLAAALFVAIGLAVFGVTRWESPHPANAGNDARP